MSLTKVQVAALAAELQNCLKGRLLTIQAISPRTFLLQIGDQKLMLCLQQPFLRFHLTSRNYSSQESPFARSLSNYLSDTQILSISQLNDDRIVQLNFNSYRLVAELFPKRPNLFLLDSEQQILLALNPVPQSHYILPIKPPSKTPLDNSPSLTSQEIERFYTLLENEAAFHDEKNQFLKLLQQRIKKALRSEQTCKEELKQGLLWKEAQHEAELLQANFFMLRRGLQQIEVQDWEQDRPRVIALDPSLEPKEEVARRFKQAKKRRLSVEHLQRQLMLIQNELIQLKKNEDSVAHAETLKELAPFAKPDLPTQEERETLRALPYREFVSASGLKIWVGKNARSNEKLTFSLAKGSDWWLHVHDYPGAHVVLRVGKQQLPDEEALQDAIQVALAYSSAKERGVAEVCVTQVKYVSKLGKGKAGKVQVSKHRLLQARFDPERFSLIKSRHSSSLKR